MMSQSQDTSGSGLTPWPNPYSVVVCLRAVSSPGFYYRGAGTNATQCPVNTYNPGFNRLTSCYNCPSGLGTAANGSDSKIDCCKWALSKQNWGGLQRYSIFVQQ
jgi:hypothetical protein